MAATAKGGWHNWWLLLYAALGTCVIFVSVAIWTPEVFFYILIVVPLISLALGGSLLILALAERRRWAVLVLWLLITYWVISAALVPNYFAIRTSARWLIWSTDYKSEAQAQPASVSGELKHLEWDGWGWAGMDTTVYLVFDPTDSLSDAAKSRRPGKFKGIPCEVPLVKRIESRWYAVEYYTNAGWNRCL